MCILQAEPYCEYLQLTTRLIFLTYLSGREREKSIALSLKPWFTQAEESEQLFLLVADDNNT